MIDTRDHGGGLDGAIARYGGIRADWLDLSTGINPVPYPTGAFAPDAWTALPDRAATRRLETAARDFWSVPEEAEIVLAPGASALIARLPTLLEGGSVCVNAPTYNEHEAAFRAAGHWKITPAAEECDTMVCVHPNNPTGRIFGEDDFGTARTIVVDESFCDVMPDASHVSRSDKDGYIVLKSFGKFWGLAGARLGAAICAPDLANRLREALGPWPVSGPVLEIGARALEDRAWADATRARLSDDAKRLDTLMTNAGATLSGGTTLFRLYEVPSATRWQDRLARSHIWSRIFPYSDTWIRLGLPAPDRWSKLEDALA